MAYAQVAAVAILAPPRNFAVVEHAPTRQVIRVIADHAALRVPPAKTALAIPALLVAGGTAPPPKLAAPPAG